MTVTTLGYNSPRNEKEKLFLIINIKKFVYIIRPFDMLKVPFINIILK